MRGVRPLTLCAPLLLLSACIVDGRYIVRGTVVGETGTTVTPLDGASVAVGSGRSANARTRTSADGSYTATYRFGGMFPFISGACPAVEFAAPDHRTRKVDLRGSRGHPAPVRSSGAFLLRPRRRPPAGERRAELARALRADRPEIGIGHLLAVT